jgi:hypothetical protein
MRLMKNYINSSTIILSFLLCMFNASESLLVGIANLSQETKPNSTKIIFLVELVKIISKCLTLDLNLSNFILTFTHMFI